MRISIGIIFICGLLAAGCTTTYLNLKENNIAQIEEKIIDYQQDEDVGSEIRVSKKNGTEINGELLSVRDNFIIICQQYSATEEELANLIYPINTVRTDEIEELKIEGNSHVITGMGAGFLVGSGIGYLVATNASNDVTFGALIGGSLIIISASVAGGIIGNTNSTDDIILSDIPPTIELSFLKILSRYQYKEPEYLQAIQ